jgi:Tol biopolymer transport system component/DNA-binding winged helix-turn-helix (wHTH) protein
MVAAMIAVPPKSRVSFGLFEADLLTGELWKAGRRIRLQSQPFKLLASLLETPGRIVTREELQLRLWGPDTVVDFDHALGTAINKVREALGDSADNPRFIETLSRRGYRFIAPVQVLSDPGTHPLDQPPAVIAIPQISGTVPTVASLQAAVEPPASGNATHGVEIPASQQTVARSGVVLRPIVWTAASVVVIAVAVGGFLVGSRQKAPAPEHIERVTEDGHLAPGLAPLENLAAGATDGIHLFASRIEGGSSQLVSIDLNSGVLAPVQLPDEVAAPSLGSLSPNGSRLLLRSHLSSAGEQSLWVVPTTGGSALRVGSILAHDATWMPNGESILAASGKSLYLINSAGAPQLYATLPGEAFWLRWNPSGTLLRFTIIDPASHTETLWQMRANDRNPVPLLNGWNNPAGECCGVWSNDGKHYVFESSRGSRSDLWELRGNDTGAPVALTDGPLNFRAPVAAPAGNRIFFLGVEERSELQRFDPATRQMVPERDFLATAVRVSYSRDGRWVCWTDSAGILWRARSDGTETLQLTPASLVVFLAHWRPDGAKLALMARKPGHVWSIYEVPATGGPIDELLHDNHNAADPSWSPDGAKLVFGRTNDVLGDDSPSRPLLVLDRNTGTVSPISGSEGLFSPRWSPDGRYIAALSLNLRGLRLYDTRTGVWSPLPVTSAADPVWSADSRYIYFHGSLDPGQPISRIDVATRRSEEVVRLNTPERADAADFVFGGLTPDNRPLVRARNVTADYYSLYLRR